MSYSLYLWQQPFLNRHLEAIATTFPVSVAGAVLCAALSYACVELPVLRLRDHLPNFFRLSRDAFHLEVVQAPRETLLGTLDPEHVRERRARWGRAEIAERFDAAPQSGGGRM